MVTSRHGMQPEDIARQYMEALIEQQGRPLVPGSIVHLRFEHEGRSIETVVEITDDPLRDIVRAMFPAPPVTES